MAKSKMNEKAATGTTRDALAPRSGPAKPALDLSLGHIGTIDQTTARLKPVEVPDDCFDWLSEDELQSETWAAFRATVNYFRLHDWSQDAELKPGTLIQMDDGQPYTGRESFAEMLVFFIGMRLSRMAASKGLDAGAIEWESFNRSHEDWPRWLGGDVVTRNFKTQGEAVQWLHSLPLPDREFSIAKVRGK